MNCIIIEDEPLALERTKNFARKIPYLNLSAMFDNGIDALIYLQENPVDLVFLDINLGELSGMKLLETAQIKSEIIITTAYDEHALKAYELRVTDYLLKPFTFERFLAAVSHAKENIDRRMPVPENKKYLFVKTAYRLEKIFLNEILYIEGMRDYRRIHTPSKKIMTLQTFSEFEQEVSEYTLCRVHKSYMVAPDKIDAIERDRIQIGKALIPISETYKKRFLELINRA